MITIHIYRNEQNTTQQKGICIKVFKKSNKCTWMYECNFITQ